jgi:hypothetical protein
MPPSSIQSDKSATTDSSPGVLSVHVIRSSATASSSESSPPIMISLAAGERNILLKVLLKSIKLTTLKQSLNKRRLIQLKSYNG